MISLTGQIRWVNKADFGLIAVLILCSFTVIPLLSEPGLPNGSDVLYHVYRVAEMNRSWENGALFPRWAEGLYYGYGSPLFHYYASLTYYLTGIQIRLLNITALETLRLIIAISLFGGGAGIYLFGKQQIGQLAGVIAGVVYVYSPYLLYTEPYARGAYPELLAFALFPFVMWRFGSLIQRPRGIHFALASASLFFLIIAHNLMALILTGLLGAWLIWALIVDRYQRKATPHPYMFGFLALFTGVGLAGYFWLPVLLESDAVDLERLTGYALLDYRNFFVALGELLAPAPIPDKGAINGLRLVLKTGVAQWIFAALGVVSVFAITRLTKGRHHTCLKNAAFFAIAGLIMIFLILPASAWVWETVRVLPLLQFPWRFLGPLAFCLAILAGMNARWIERLPGRIGAGMIAAFIALPIALAFPLLRVPEWHNTAIDVSIAAYHAAEVAGLQRGTTFTDEYRPRAVTTLPGATPSLLADYADGYPIDKANRHLLPEGAALELVENSPQYHEWRISAPQSFTMEVYIFDWAGWSAEIDGQAVAITPSLHHGLITFPVPAGDHTIRVYLGSTPARDLGNAVSLVSIALLAIGFIRLRQPASPAYSTSSPLQASQRAGIIIGGLVALSLAPLLLREGVSYYRSAPGEAIPAQHAVLYHLDDEISLIGYDINRREFHPGEQLELNLYWYPLAEPKANYSSFVHVSTGGPPIAQADKLHPGGRAMDLWWKPDAGYIFDDYAIRLPENLPPGEYTIYAGLYTCELMPADNCGNGYRPTVTDGEGKALGDAVNLGTIVVR